MNENDFQSTIGLGFDNLCVGNDDVKILNNVSGYVIKGGVTAVLGPSAAGKSFLLQTLSGRITEFPIKGTVFMNGQVVDPSSRSNPVAYVPQDDSVIGELTSREVTMYTAQLKRNESKETLKKDVDELIKKLGLSHVADGIIGTFLYRGISGGQKKRAEISCELIASPSILLLDEPTSGLDSSIAYEVLNLIREIVKSSDGKLSVILTIHQPNSRLLELFDHILLLDRGSTTFFGTMQESLDYFSRLGYPCPHAVTPTDYFLKVSDSNFSFAEVGADFKLYYTESQQARSNHELLSKHFTCASNYDEKEKNWSKSNLNANTTVPFWKQVYFLIYREYTLAYRDPTLHYFQVSLLFMFGFMAGAIFFFLPHKVTANFNIYPGGLLWLILMFSWAHAFKVFHMSKTNKRTKHEVANKKYSLWAFILADTFTTATMLVFLVPVIPIAYFMMDFPKEAFPFALLLCWTASMSAEAMLSFITKFSSNATTSMVFCQMALVLLQQFGSGVFIPWKDTPKYWVWVQESDLYTQATRSLIMKVMDHMQFRCELAGDGKCYNPGTGKEYTCASFESNGNYCQVDGREIFYLTQGISTERSHWEYYGYLCCIGVAYKVLGIFLDFYSIETIINAVKSTLFPKKKVDDDSNATSVIEMADVNKSKSVQQQQQQEQAYEQILPIQTVIEVTEPLAMASTDFDGKVAPTTSLTWTDFNITLPNGKKLVDNVSGFVTSGSILALMGPSGAGKTTLLNGLAYRAKYANITGKVMFAGRKMTPADLTYVPQFDELNETLTVEEHMLLIGHLTCTDKEEMLERCAKLLDVLGLVGKKSVQVSQLSGGEKKRLSVGIGMISNPNVLFLDEPTTGLDSTAAFSIVNYLKIMAKATNVAIIMTIHQPSALVFDLLDSLYLLEMGHLVYSGKISAASDYFSSIGYNNPDGVNLADHYLELVQNPPDTDKSEVTWNSLFKQSNFHKLLSKELEVHLSSQKGKEAPAQPPFVKRFYYMLQYFMKYFYKQHGYYFHRLLALIIIAVFVGTLYLNLDNTTDNIGNYVGAMFSLAIGAMLTAIASTSLFAKDRREAVDRVENGMFTPGVFVLTQTIASSIYNFCIAVVYMCILYWLIPLSPSRECFVYAIFSSWGYLMLMESALLVAIEVMKNDFLCTTFGMIFLGANMCFCGFFRAVEDSPVWINWMCYVLPIRWSFDGFVFQIFNNRNFIISGITPEMTISGYDILVTIFKLTKKKAPSNGWGLFGALIGYIMMFRFVQYLLFAYQTNSLPRLLKRKADVTLAASG